MAPRTHKLFCADLDYMEVLVPRYAATGDATTREQDNFKLLPPAPDEDGGSEEWVSIREHNKIITTKEIKDLIDADQLGGNGDVSSRLSSHDRMKSKLLRIVRPCYQPELRPITRKHSRKVEDPKQACRNSQKVLGRVAEFTRSGRLCTRRCARQ
jgi:hypothetical protein